MRYYLFLSFALQGICGATAQPYRLYDVPQPTAEVRMLRADASVWRPSIPLSGPLPSSVDNSQLKYFPKVFSQQGGSCAQSSGIRYLFTYEMNRLLDRNAQASEANTYSYFYTWNFLNEGIDQGGFVEQGLHIARRQGIMSLADFPDPPLFSFKWASGYDRYIRAMHNRVREIVSIEVTSQEGIDLVRRYLYDAGDGSTHGGILSYATLAEGGKFDKSYSGPSETGYTCLQTELATRGAHAMTIVGYDDTVEFFSEGKLYRGAFIVVNSYGQWWGDDGRFYLPYCFFLRRHPSTVLSHEVVGCRCESRPPQVVFRVKVSYDSRNDLSFTMGVADQPYAAVPTVTLRSVIADNQGGDHPMPGRNSDSNSLEIAFDFTEAVSKYASYVAPKYFLTVTRSEVGAVGHGVLESFSVLDLRNPDTPEEYVCDLPGPVELQRGDNLFSVATTPLRTTSASPLRWLDSFGNPHPQPYVLRTASGKYAKFEVSGYDRTSGRMTVRYLYRDDGSRDLNSLTN